MHLPSIVSITVYMTIISWAVLPVHSFQVCFGNIMDGQVW